jgi:hypothetical protein
MRVTSQFYTPKTVYRRPKEQPGNQIGRDRLRNNCLQIILGSSLQAKSLLESTSQYQVIAFVLDEHCWEGELRLLLAPNVKRPLNSILVRKFDPVTGGGNEVR